MKKLLGLLSSISLIASTSGVAVACGTSNTRISSPSLNEDLAKKIIASLGGDIDFQFSDLFSDVDLTTAVVNEINRLVSINYDFERTNANLTALGLNTFDSDEAGQATFQTQFDNLIKTTAENKLFSEYSKSVATSNSNSLDFSMGSEFYSLNPIKDTNITGTDGATYTVFSKAPIKVDGKVWEINGEQGATSSTTPTVEQLTKEYTGADSLFTVADSHGNDISISATTALSLRFQDYFENKEMKDVMSNALTMVYNQSSLWRNAKNNQDAATAGQLPESSPYIDITNPVFSKTQSWAGDLTTNVKMVWVYTIKGTTDEDGNPTSSAATVTKAAKEALTDIIDVNGNLMDGKTVGNIFDALNKMNNANGNDTDGYDPYFGQSGYKGIVVSKDGTTIGDNPISGAAYESAVNDSSSLRNKGGITLNGDSWAFANADNSQDFDIVIKLPIYMMQLLGVNKVINPGTDETPNAVNIYKVTGNGDANESVNQREIQFQRSPDTATGSKFSEIWRRNYNDLSSTDIDTIASDSEKQTTMFQEIEYLISQDSTNQETAKRVVYSKYLDADLIYYAGLYDQIGTYITTSSDEDE